MHSGVQIMRSGSGLLERMHMEMYWMMQKKDINKKNERKEKGTGI